MEYVTLSPEASTMVTLSPSPDALPQYAPPGP
jgi:hypothetical protein